MKNWNSKYSKINEFQKKISLLPVTYSNSILKDLNEPLGKEFLWFYGYGAVHKGLDILLDIFSEKKEEKIPMFLTLQAISQNFQY